MQHDRPPLNATTPYLLGIDVGSTTVKTVLLDPTTLRPAHSRYERHNAKQIPTLLGLFRELRSQHPDLRLRVAVCGSGASAVTTALGAFFIQEVVANAIAVREYHGNARVAIELGGQDAKVIFFEQDSRTGRLSAADLRMNGSCAGGTGAFIDQVAELLNVTPEEFAQLASKGQQVYAISGRCGVFAKTDIQPLLNQGVPTSDIALSTLHAIAKQTIGGLAQGATIHPPVLFEGGPLTYNPKLIDVFAERLALSKEDIIIPLHPEVIVACGAAMAAAPAYSGQDRVLTVDEVIAALETWHPPLELLSHDEAFFKDVAERESFLSRHALPTFQAPSFVPGSTIQATLGIDAGSTTSKLVLIDEEGHILYRFYAGNEGDPLEILKDGLLEMRRTFEAQGVKLEIRGVGTTGYGELLCAKAFRADYHMVETVSHAEAALRVAPDASFILDIGGQDMKAITLRGGVVTSIVLNEACSAGCGSFLETYAKSLNIAVADVAAMAFSSDTPSRLGSRCTVFMNSSIVTEQRSGKTPADIMAGLVRSIIENVFTKVVRLPNYDQLGDTILVQGGTFKNDAVLRALEQFTGRTVIRAPYPGEMGAWGIALLTQKHIAEQTANGTPYQSSFIGLEALEALRAEKKLASNCKFCTNDCARSVVEFGNGDTFVTGNRCERGEVLGSAKDTETREKLQAITARMNAVPDLFKVRNRLLFKDYAPKILAPSRGIKIGIPRVLEYWESMPFWKAFFTSLGFEVVISSPSSYSLFESGLQQIPSDTVCFPGKLVHGHIQDLATKKVDRMFMPIVSMVPLEGMEAEGGHMCAVVQGYPIVIQVNDEPERRFGIPLDAPLFRWASERMREKQIASFMTATFQVDRKSVFAAIHEGDRALAQFRHELRQAGKEALESIESSESFAVVLAGRPYHHDDLVNHGLSSLFTANGVPVLCLDAIPELAEVDMAGVRPERVNPLHTKLFAAAKIVAKHPKLQMAQVVSFGCGHDAINTDEVSRILETKACKQLLVLKLDEGEALGPLRIRIKSFVETIRMAHDARTTIVQPIGEAFTVSYDKEDKATKTILIPNLSEGFATVTSALLKSRGYLAEPLPLAQGRAKELGKRYVHNDVCYPAQVNIGEFLAAMESGRYDPRTTAFGLSKNCDDCLAGQYVVLARKALDEAGYPEIPIVTTGEDRSGLHPGFNGGLWFQTSMLYGLTILDAFDDMVRKTRPYEQEIGKTELVFREHVAALGEAIGKGHAEALRVLERAVDAFNAIPVNRPEPKPRVLVVGEILLNFHPSANEQVVRYMETNGMEVVMPTMTDFFRRDLVRRKEGLKRDMAANPVFEWALTGVTDWMYGRAIDQVEERMEHFRYFEKRASIHELGNLVAEFVDKTYIVGEGWAIAAEILEYAAKGVESFVIVQPFGCRPNHISGRGLLKAIKQRYPLARIIALDYDADASFANLENRLQMLVMAQREGART